jgi:hypothetical protein
MSARRGSWLGSLPYFGAALFPALLVAAAALAAWWLGGEFGRLRRQVESARPEGLIDRERAELEALRKERDALWEPIRRHAAERDQRLDARENELKARIADLARLPAPKPPDAPPAVAKPQDILIAVLHSKKVSYNRDCLAALVKFCQEASSKTHRLAVTAVLTDHVYPPVIKFGEDVRKRHENAFNLNLPLDHPSENADHAVGEGLRGLLNLDPEAKRSPRLILVASTQCRPPDPAADAREKTPGWRGMQGVRVDAILIQPQDKKDAPPDPGDRAAGWLAFCGRSGGCCHALWRRADPAAMTELLLASLREIAPPGGASPRAKD